MRRVAMFGVFDIPNYGDHLFPRILVEELTARNCDCEVVLFSAFDADESFVDNSQVYSADRMEKMHQDKPFDAIVVGGGEIIHWHAFQQKMKADSEDFVDYPMAKIWLVPFSMRLKYGVPVFWNLPGIPFDFNESRELANCIFSGVDYLSVRNDFSKQVLLNCGIDESLVTVAPDTGFVLDRISSPEILQQKKQETFPEIGKYVVFHCNRFISQEDTETVIKTLTHIHNVGYEIVLLPLAYTHGDESILQTICEKLPFEGKMPGKMLSLLEILGVLANCDLYVGTSLHGSVTAAVYGNKVVSFDYQQTKKTKDLYQIMGLSQYYVTDADLLEKTVFSALDGQIQPDFHDIRNKIDAHFDTLAAKITHSSEFTEPKVPDIASISELVQDHFEKRTQTFGLLRRIDELHSALETNINLGRLYSERIETLSDEVHSLQNELESKTNHRSKLQRRIKKRIRTFLRFLNKNSA